MSLLVGLAAAIERLARLHIGDAARHGLQQAAEQLQASVQETLSRLPGEDHAAPWLRTGSLRGSVSSQIDDATALIGSDDPIAVDQELGTRTIPPRPFLSSTAAAEGERAADTFAAAMFAKLGA
jgi:phage gpG-like protein